jgi:flagellar biosynthesis GTPase FlhF
MIPEVVEHTGDKDNKTTDRGESWMRVRFPRGAVHPYEFTDKNEKTWDKAIVNIPDDENHPIKINGVNLAGYSFDTFLTSRQLSQIANGEGATISFKPDQKVELFKGKDDARKTLALDPGPLAHAVKVYREQYAASKQSEREKDSGPERSEAEKAAKPGKEEAEKETKPEKADKHQKPKGTSLNERGQSAKAIREAKAADAPQKALARQPQGHL